MNTLFIRATISPKNIILTANAAFVLKADTCNCNNNTSEGNNTTETTTSSILTTTKKNSAAICSSIHIITSISIAVTLLFNFSSFY